MNCNDTHIKLYNCAHSMGVPNIFSENYMITNHTSNLLLIYEKRIQLILRIKI